MYSSCRLSSYIPKEEKIITKNIVYINNKKIYDDKEYKNLIYTNENYRLLGFPIGLFLYEKIQENPETYFEELKNNNSKTNSLIEDIFSKKSVRKLKKNYILLNNKIKDEYSEKPVFFNQEYLEKSNKNLINYFQEKGYLDVKIDNNVNIENHTAILEYKINTGELYKINNIKLLTKSPEIEIEFKKYDLNIKKDDVLDFNKLKKERLDIANFFKDNGFYFFNASKINLEIDTSAIEKKVDVYIHILEEEKYKGDSIIYKNHNKYKISDIKIFTNYKFDTIRDLYQVDNYGEYNILQWELNRYSSKIISSNILYSTENYYSYNKDRQTRNFINRLNNFKLVDILYFVDSSKNELKSEIRLQPSPKYWINYELLASTSNILEFGIEFNFINGIRNLIGMADILQFNISGTAGNYRGFLNTGFLNSFIFNPSINWTVPCFLFPFSDKLNTSKEIRPRTEFKLSYNYQKNIGLDRRDFIFSVSTIWNESEYKEHKIMFPYFKNTQYLNKENYFNFYISERNKVRNIYISMYGQDAIKDKAFSEITSEIIKNINNLSAQNLKTLLDINFRYLVFTSDMFIPSLKYIYTYNNLQKKNNWTFFKLELESAGNIFIPLLKSFNLIKKDSLFNTFLGTPIFNYGKIDLTFIKYIKFGENYNYLAFKSFLGLGIPLGDNKNIPYQEMYFSGGTNNERAWLAYDLGPGTNKERALSLNVADMKLSFSLEYRFNIYKAWKGAVFIDAGNIWRYNNIYIGFEDNNIEVFKLNRFYKELAVGIGYGIRYDLDMFVFRLDMAYKMIDPAQDEHKRFVLPYQDFLSPVFHFGITYPF